MPPTLSEIRESGINWSFAFTLDPFPDYILLTLRGQPEIERTQRIIEVAREHRERLLLPNGKLCPLIVDRRHDSIPSLATLRAGRAFLEEFRGYMSYLVFLVEPHRQNRLLMDVALDILSVSSSLHIAIAESLEEAIAKVAAYHELGTVHSHITR